MKERKFKMVYWLHSHHSTGEFLDFELIELEGRLHTDIIYYITDSSLMNIEVANNDLNSKQLLDKVLESNCVFHFDDYTYNEEPWIEFLDTKVSDYKETP